MLELFSFLSERVRVLLNRANTKVGMTKKEVESALEMKVRFEVPSDRAVPLAVNRGNPAVLADPGADFSQALRAMAKEIAPKVEEQAAGKRKFLSFSRS